MQKHWERIESQLLYEAGNVSVHPVYSVYLIWWHMYYRMDDDYFYQDLVFDCILIFSVTEYIFIGQGQDNLFNTL